MTAAGVLLLCALVGHQRAFEVTYIARVIPPRGAAHVEVWVPCPRIDAHQDVLGLSVKCPHPVETFYDRDFGNCIVHVDARGARPFSVEVRTRVVRSEWTALADHAPLGSAFPDRERGGPLERFLEAGRLVSLSDRVRAIAARVTKGRTTPMDKARALYDYVLTTMTYDKSGTGWGRGDTEYACDVRRGNCTDFHSLFISLARASGIPAQFVMGALIPEGRDGTISGYHCWAKFYAPDRGWVPVDISEAWHHRDRADYYFGSIDDNRIALSEGRDILLEPPQRGDRLNYFFPPYVEVDGRPWDGVTTDLAFTDLGP